MPSKVPSSSVAETARVHARGLREAGATITDPMVAELASSSDRNANRVVRQSLHRHRLLASVKVDEIKLDGWTPLC